MDFIIAPRVNYDVRKTLDELKVPYTIENIKRDFYGTRYLFERKYFKKVEKAMPGYARACFDKMAITVY